MVPSTFPSSIQNKCCEFVLNFRTRSAYRLQPGLTHDGNWKESNEKLTEVAVKILDILKSIWCNPAFGPEFIDTLNEGTYVNNVVATAILATFFDNPFGESAFFTT